MIRFQSYSVVQSESIPTLAAQVTAALRGGWTPVGGPFVVQVGMEEGLDTTICQAMGHERENQTL